MKKIILDTVFLLIPYQFKVDIISEIRRIADFSYRLFIIDRTLDELESIIASQKGKDARAAKFAKELVKKEGIGIIKTCPKTETYKNVDSLILSAANSDDFIVATQDTGLRKELKKKGIRTIGMRQKRHLNII